MTADDTTPARVHNHPPYRPVCRERRLPDGQIRGACLDETAERACECETLLRRFPATEGQRAGIDAAIVLVSMSARAADTGHQGGES